MDILQIPLFSGISENSFSQMQTYRCMRRQTFPRGAYILRAGTSVREIGVLLSGSVHIETIDVWGNKSILSSLDTGKIFAETYALCKEPILVDVVAAEKTEILFLDLQQLQNSASRNFDWYVTLLQNLLCMSARNNLALSARIFCTGAKSVRGRVLTYLSAQAVQQGSTDITLPFDRQQMADYLNLDRSALSRELSRMRREGLLAYHKNHFTLLQLGK